MYKRSYLQQRKVNLRFLYKMELEEFEKILADQGGKCAICDTSTPQGKHNQWCVDHDHDTKQVRGLLCSNCNMGIGKFKDSPDLLLKAADYLEKNHLRFVDPSILHEEGQLSTIPELPEEGRLSKRTTTSPKRVR